MASELLPNVIGSVTTQSSVDTPTLHGYLQFDKPLSAGYLLSGCWRVVRRFVPLFGDSFMRDVHSTAAYSLPGCEVH